MSPTVSKSLRYGGLALLLTVLLFSAARAASIPRPEGLRDDVNFWIRVYT
jgi:hypothetical protein